MPNDPEQTNFRLLVAVELLDKAVAGLQTAINQVKQEIEQTGAGRPSVGKGGTDGAGTNDC